MEQVFGARRSMAAAASLAAQALLAITFAASPRTMARDNFVALPDQHSDGAAELSTEGAAPRSKMLRIDIYLAQRHEEEETDGD